jgi:hypothetical protein
LFLTQSVLHGKLPLVEVIGEPSYAEALLQDAAELDAAITFASEDALAKDWLLPEEDATWANL